MKQKHPIISVEQKRKIFLLISASLISGLSAGQAFAAGTISNTATANGTPVRGTLTAPTATATINIEDSAPSFTIVKSVQGVTTSNGTNNTIVDDGDIITYKVAVTNTGDQTLTGITISDDGPTFNSRAADNTLSAFTHDSGDGDNTAASGDAIGLSETAVFTATYTMSEADYLYGSQIANGVSNTASVTTTEVTTAKTDSVTYDIPANPALSVTKSASLSETNGTTDDSAAAVGDTITYTYTVENTGNVPIDNVTITDEHEDGETHAVTVVSTTSMTNESLSSDGPLADLTTDSIASSDATSDDGNWDKLQPGATITFTYTHTVTQEEFDAQ